MGLKLCTYQIWYQPACDKRLRSKPTHRKLTPDRTQRNAESDILCATVGNLEPGLLVWHTTATTPTESGLRPKGDAP